MKKLTRKLFISVMTLVLTAMALGTSTFAWFSMNTTASATGMEVQAKSNAIYLLISDTAACTDANSKSGLTDTTVAVLQDSGSGDALKRYPAYYGSPADIKTGETGNVGWYYANNKNADSSTDDVVNVNSITTANLSKYVLTYKVWLTLSADSEAYNGAVTCSLLKVSGSDPSIAAVVEINGEKISLNPTDTQAGSGTAAGAVMVSDTTTNNVSITATTAVEVTIYIYIDGTSANVYSDYINQQSITGKCSVQFDLN